jgi:hypothetical protein
MPRECVDLLQGMVKYQKAMPITSAPHPHRFPHGHWEIYPSSHLYQIPIFSVVPEQSDHVPAAYMLLCSDFDTLRGQVGVRVPAQDGHR